MRVRWMMVVGLLGLGCGGDKDSGACDDGSVVKVSIIDSNSGNPTQATVAWTDAAGGTGSMDCPGACEFSPAAEGTVTVVATPLDSALGDPQEDSTNFARSADCSQPVYALLDFTF